MLTSLKLGVYYWQGEAGCGVFAPPVAWFDIRILWLTLVKVLRRDGVSH